MGNEYVMFDVDGTVKAVRQRYLSERESYPAARRRSAGVSLPGYRGRKRGEAVRTRTTVAVAHTSEWLGSYGSAGNGDVGGELSRSLVRIAGYLEAQGLRVSHGMVRLDGLYGSPKLVSQVQQNGIGYLMRSRDYGLLKHPVVVSRLQETEGWETVDGKEYEQRKDLGYIEDGGRGYSSPFRLIVVRTPEAEHQGRLGKRYKGQVYELFITSQSASSLQSGDVLSLYFGRGGFERRLKEEDEEQEMDRWCSWSASGQEFWQILSQWVWNWRVWMGWQQAESPPVRQTLWAGVKALPAVDQLEREELLPRSLWLLREQHCRVRKPVEAGKTPPAPMLAKAWERYGPLEVRTEGSGEPSPSARYRNEDFQVLNSETVICPAGYQMSQISRRQEENGDLRYQFSLSRSICQDCEMRERCLSPQSQGKSGKRVSVVQRQYRADPQLIPLCSALVRSVIERLSEPDISPQAIVWQDIAATQLRREWRKQLAAHELGIQVFSSETKRDQSDSVAMQSRHQREHHRLSWKERAERNRRDPDAMCWRVLLWDAVEQLIWALQRLIEQKPVVTG